jgi:DNA polymerase (family 10)
MKISKNMTNLEIADLLRAVAASYRLKGEMKNRYRITAYERAADAVEHATSELKDLWDDGKLEDLPSIGKSIASHLDEIFRSGRSIHFEELMRGLPPSMFEFIKLPGIGAKTAFRLAHELNLRSVEDLQKAAESGKVALLEGFGEKSQEEILSAIQAYKKNVRRILLPYAYKISEDVVKYMEENKSVVRADALGSVRRRNATVGDIDVACSIKNDLSEEEFLKVVDYFCNYPRAVKVIEKGSKTGAVEIAGGIRVDLMLEYEDGYGALLQHFTGSKHHNIALREYALRLTPPLSLSEYGITPIAPKASDGDKISSDKKTIKFRSEEDFYNFLQMDYIEPELRENTGEIKAAIDRALPSLVRLEDIKSDLHVHSDFDVETSHDLGESTVYELVEKASSLGYEYFALTEHNPSQRGHTELEIINILKKKKKLVEEVNSLLSRDRKRWRVRRVFNSLEIDIKPNGDPALPERAMELLDFALVSIHSSFGMGKDEMTRRVLNALSYPNVKIFAHPTARKLNEREGVEIDWERIFEYCVKNDKWLEINADSMRLDLPDVLVREAIKFGVKLTIGTDTHHKAHMDNMRWGVSVARRGWAERKDIINSLSLDEFTRRVGCS